MTRRFAHRYIFFMMLVKSKASPVQPRLGIQGRLRSQWRVGVLPPSALARSPALLVGTDGYVSEDLEN